MRSAASDNHARAEVGTRVLFVSNIVVTPATGGGNFVYNVLEPAPKGSEIFYAGPASYPPHMAPYPGIVPRIRSYSVESEGLVPVLREGTVRKRLRSLKGTLRLEGLSLRLNAEKMKVPFAEHIVKDIEELQPDLLLFAPQPLLDVVVAGEISRRSGLPYAVWFMDDYYKDRYSKARVKELWRGASARFVSSDSMKEKFSTLYGGSCEVVLSPIRTPTEYLPPEPSSDGRLRVAYAGTVNDYYAAAMRKVLRELRGLSDRLALDVYTADPLPAEGLENDVPLRHRSLVLPDELVEKLRGYDVLLLLSSFEPEWRTVAETAQAGKMADYLAAGRCILAFGPQYADNVQYVRKHGIGELVTSDTPGALRATILSLLDEPGRRQELGKKAHKFGLEHRDRTKSHEYLWRTLIEAVGDRSLQ